MTATSENRKPGKITFAAVGTAATSIVAILTLIWVVFPGFKPQAPPPKLSASLSNASLEHNITLGDYIRTYGYKLERTAEFYILEEGHNGFLVHFDVEIEGFKGRKCILEWSLMDADSRSRFTEFSHIADLYFTPEADLDKANGTIWVPYPQSDSNFFVRLELFDDKGVRLHQLDTEVIEVNR